MGPSGSGKTYSVSTFVEAGIETFFLGTEPNATEALFDAMDRRKLNWDLLHYHQVIPASAGWDALEENVKLVGQMSYEDLSKMSQGIAKRKMSHLMDFVQCCKDFPDDRTGNYYGDVTTWGPDRAFVIDSLSGINKMAREYVAGYKPTLHQGEWGTAMQLEENILYKLAYDRKCFLALLAHVDREVDEVLGGSRITLAALGKKLAPQLIKYFSEVVLTKRVGADFVWSTMESATDVKNRSLPIGDRLKPSFAPIVEAYRKRVANASIVASPATV